MYFTCSSVDEFLLSVVGVNSDIYTLSPASAVHLTVLHTSSAMHRRQTAPDVRFWSTMRMVASIVTYLMLSAPLRSTSERSARWNSAGSCIQGPVCQLADGCEPGHQHHSCSLKRNSISCCAEEEHKEEAQVGNQTHIHFRVQLI